MGYSSIRSDRQHQADAARIRELEAALREKDRAEKVGNVADGHVTIEKTSRKLKKRLLVSWAATILGGILTYYFSCESELAVTVVPKITGGICVLGILSVIATKITIWWEHG